MIQELVSQTVTPQGLHTVAQGKVGEPPASQTATLGTRGKKHFHVAADLGGVAAQIRGNVKFY